MSEIWTWTGTMQRNNHVSSVQRRAMVVTIVNMPTNVPILPKPNGLSKTVHFTYKKKNQAIKIERNVSYPEARTLVSMANDSCAQTAYANVTNTLFYLGENPNRHHLA